MQKTLIRKSREAFIPCNLSNLHLYTNNPERRHETVVRSILLPWGKEGSVSGYVLSLDFTPHTFFSV